MNTFKSKIKNIRAKTVLTSQRTETVAVELETDDGLFLSSAPAGVSTGLYEAAAVEAKQAVKNIEQEIAPQLLGQEPASQQKIDQLLIRIDGTENKKRLGANALLAVSIALVRAGAQSQKLSLYKYVSKLAGTKPAFPAPFLLLAEGGKHGTGRLALQEFMAVSQGPSFKDNLAKTTLLYRALEKTLGERFLEKGVLTGLEGGLTPPVKNSREMLDFISEAIIRAGLKDKVKIALDTAASHFFKDGCYQFESKKMTLEELADFYLSLTKKYPIYSIEDPFEENDWPSWQTFSSKLKVQSSKLLVVGDDLTATNPDRIKRAKEEGACNGVIIKPNQIGTVSEAIEAAQLAKSFGWKVIVSHRAGETKDDFIADLSVGLGADFIKAGGPEKPERKAKYDRLLAIEQELCIN